VQTTAAPAGNPVARVGRSLLAGSVGVTDTTPGTAWGLIPQRQTGGSGAGVSGRGGNPGRPGCITPARRSAAGG